MNTNILIHCSTGLQCSVGLICSYLIKKYQYTYQQAIDLVKRKYPKFQK
jgi:protein-tyrosine phosphatase